MKSARALTLLLYLSFPAALAQAAQADDCTISPRGFNVFTTPAPAEAAAPGGAGGKAATGAAAGSAGAGAAIGAAAKGGTSVAATAEAGKPATTGASGEAAAPAGPDEVKMKADTLAVDLPAERYIARGDVHAVQDGVSLLADSVIYQRISGDALAEGNVSMEKSGDTLKGESLSLNMYTHLGELHNGELFIKKPNFYIRGKRVEKTGDEDYRAENASFTTCDGPNPSWRFEARKVEVTLDEFATARDAVFYAGDIPLLYTPYLIFPVKRERQSGLLLPRLGHSTKKGFYYDQPYYWAINQSMDLTADLDIETARGVGVAEDYRYMRALGSEGRLRSFGIYDTKVERFRGELDQNHLEVLSPKTTLASSIHLITDRSYYLDYGEIAGDYNRQLLESSVSFDHSWDRYGVATQFLYTEDLLAPNNDQTLQRLPTVSFFGAGQRIGPVFFSMDSNFTNFQRNQGTEGQRLILHPRLALYEKPGAVDLSLYAGYRQRLYNAYGGEPANGAQQAGNADAGATASLPLERVYDGRFRHLLIPALQYGFVQQRHDDNMPLFDFNDRVLGQNTVTWSVTSVLTGKYANPNAAPEYRDLLYLKLSEGYQFSGDLGRDVPDPVTGVPQRERRDLTTLVDPGHHLTDLLLEGRANPVRRLSLEFDSRYNPVDNNISTANVAVEVVGEGATSWVPGVVGNPQTGEPSVVASAAPSKQAPLAAVAYRYSRNEVDYLEGRLSFPLVKELSATVIGRYSFDRGAFLESRYALEYKRQCWSVIAAYADRVGSSQVSANKQFTINFNLYGVGVVGPGRAF